jgi:tetratricopeptide (TPR) repeat protein
MRFLISRTLLLAMLFGTCRLGLSLSEPPQGNATAQTSVSEGQKTCDAFRAQKDYPKAIACFQDAVKKDGKNAVLYNKLGMAELQASELPGALADFTKATKLNPRFAEAQNNIGAVYYVQRKYNAATKYFKKAVALDETHATYHVNLGAAWFGMNNLDRALAEYSRALQLDPDVLAKNTRTGITAQLGTPEERARYEFMMAKVYAQLGDTDRCLECLRRAKEGGYRDLGKVYEDQEFAVVRGDARLATIIPPPASK